MSDREPSGQRRAHDRLLAWLPVWFPPLLFAILRPETYGQIPNPLDPVFYTGLAINFDAISATLDDRFYFIARWSTYLPQRLFTGLFGVIAGRLMWRWLLASLILAMLFRFGRRWSWTLGQRLLIGTAVVTTPIFLRSFMSDYIEYAVVALGLVLAARAVGGDRWVDARTALRGGALLGVLVGLIVVANPFGLVMCALISACALVVQLDRSALLDRSSRQTELTRIGAGAMGIAAGALFIVVSGWIVFRVIFDQPNLYGSTLEMISKIGNDPLKSPRLEWLGRFTWLYITPILAAGFLVIAAVQNFRGPRSKPSGRLGLARVEWAVLVLALASWAYQWVDQFVRGGPGLELSYYFAYSVPSMLLLLACLLARCTRHLRWQLGALLSAGWMAAVYWGGSVRVELPAAWGFAALAVCVLAIAGVVAARSGLAAGSIVIGLVLAAQLLAPSYDPSAYHLYNVSPRLDELYLASPTHSERTLSELMWIREALADAPGIDSAAFIPTGGWLSDSNYVAGLFGPQPTGRLMYVVEGMALAPQTEFEIGNGSRPYVAVVGDPTQVGEAVRQLRSRFPEAVLERDEAHSGGLGMRVAYLWVPHQSRLPATWSASDLYVQDGTVEGTEVRSVNGQAGLLTYGPYLVLSPGSYVATLRYAASGSDGSPAGSVDVLINGSEVRVTAPIPASAGEPTNIDIAFQVNSQGERVEVRPSSTGAENLRVKSLEIRAG
jgi:hypothetical protein